MVNILMLFCDFIRQLWFLMEITNDSKKYFCSTHFKSLYGKITPIVGIELKMTIEGIKGIEKIMIICYNHIITRRVVVMKNNKFIIKNKFVFLILAFCFLIPMLF